jgi:hypothetical protein
MVFSAPPRFRCLAIAVALGGVHCGDLDEVPAPSDPTVDEAMAPNTERAYVVTGTWVWTRSETGRGRYQTLHLSRTRAPGGVQYSAFVVTNLDQCFPLMGSLSTAPECVAEREDGVAVITASSTRATSGTLRLQPNGGGAPTTFAFAIVPVGTERDLRLTAGRVAQTLRPYGHVDLAHKWTAVQARSGMPSTLTLTDYPVIQAEAVRTARGAAMEYASIVGTEQRFGLWRNPGPTTPHAPDGTFNRLEFEQTAPLSAGASASSPQYLCYWFEGATGAARRLVLASTDDTCATTPPSNATRYRIAQ